MRESMARILLVEDNTMICRIWKLQLEKSGHEVASVQTGDEALEHLARETPDLMLTDVMLPGMSGLELVEKLRADERTRNIPVIVLSALSSQRNKEQALSLGVARYIVKSECSPDRLAAAVSEVLKN